MPFLDDLTTMLGGWSDVKQIDKQGFDFREQRRQAELARQQQQQQWQQENEDWATKALTEASLGAPEGTDVSGLIPRDVNAARVSARLKGLGMQSRSNLEEMRKQRELELQALRNAGGIGRVEAAAKAAAPAREDTQQHQMEMLRLRLEEVAKQGGLNRENALLLAALRSGGGGGGAGKWAWNTKTNAAEYVTDEALKSAPPGLYTDVTSGRQRSSDIAVGENAATALGEMKDRLKRYEDTQKGLGRYVPAQMSPEKYVAWDAYRSSLQSMGQFFGRQMMKDARVSNEDRQAYANAIGVANQITTMLDPKEARRRADFLEQMMTHYQMKYGGLGTGEPSTGGAETMGTPQRRTFGGRTYQLKAGANPDLKSSWEAVRE